MHIHGLLVCYVWALLSYSMSNRTLKINWSQYAHLCLLHYQHRYPVQYFKLILLFFNDKTRKHHPRSNKSKKRTVQELVSAAAAAAAAAAYISYIVSHELIQSAIRSRHVIDFTQNRNNKNQELDNGFLCLHIFEGGDEEEVIYRYPFYWLYANRHNTNMTNNHHDAYNYRAFSFNFF